MSLSTSELRVKLAPFNWFKPSSKIFIAGKELTSWLSFVVSNCEFDTFPLVSWVRCGT